MIWQLEINAECIVERLLKQSLVRTLAASSHIFILLDKCSKHSLSKRAGFES